jgi:hypothetical protein
MPPAVTSTLDVSYHQYYLSDVSVDLAQVPLDELLRGGNGLIAVTPGFAVVHAGTHTGQIQVAVDARPGPPPLDVDTWQEVVEVSLTSTTGLLPRVSSDANTRWAAYEQQESLTPPPSTWCSVARRSRGRGVKHATRSRAAVCVCLS